MKYLKAFDLQDVTFDLLMMAVTLKVRKPCRSGVLGPRRLQIIFSQCWVAICMLMGNEIDLPLTQKQHSLLSHGNVSEKDEILFLYEMIDAV